MRKRISKAACLFAVCAAVALVLAGTAAGEVSRKGLVAEYHFDGNAKDSSGNGNDGIIYGAAFVDGKFGKALSFDGVSNYVNVAGVWGGTNWQEATIEAWVSTKSTTGDFQAIVSSTDADFVHLQLHSWGNIAIFTDKIKPYIFLPIISQKPTGAWRHIAVSIKSGNTKLYENGVEIGFDAGTFSYITHAAELHIGNGYQNGRFFNGIVDEVRIYNRALSPGEIKANYNAGQTTSTITKTTSAPGIIAEYHFDGDAKDSGGKGNDGVIHGATFVDGKFGKALSFDGVSNYVEVPHSPALNPQFPFTVEFWGLTRAKTVRQTWVSTNPMGIEAGWEIVSAENGRLMIGESINGIWQRVFPYSYPTNQFIHYAVVFENGGITLFINGVKQSSNPVQAGSLTYDSQPLRFGSPLTGGYWLLNGIMDEVRIYNRALSAEEIKASYEVGQTTSGATKTAITPEIPAYTPAPTPGTDNTVFIGVILLIIIFVIVISFMAIIKRAPPPAVTQKQEEAVAKPSAGVSLKELNGRLNQITALFDKLDESLAQGEITEAKYKELTEKYRTEVDSLKDQIAEKKFI